ncbi:integrase, partial [Citrobacter sp. 966a]|nr:integrase [Citrobacter amalonaticus]
LLDFSGLSSNLAYIASVFIGFAVSRLANKGVDILKVSRLIGHSNIKTTMDVYGHLFGEVVEMDLD